MGMFGGALLIALWGAVAWFFYAPATPLGEQEIDAYMVKVQTLLEQSFVMPEGSGLDPRGLEGALADLRAFAERDDGKPVYMVNLMKWREGELSFPAGADLANGISTAEEADIDCSWQSLSCWHKYFSVPSVPQVTVSPFS